jgi:hypothetical protein
MLGGVALKSDLSCLEILEHTRSTIFWSPSDKNSPQKNDKVLGNFDANYNYLSKNVEILKKLNSKKINL